jgi:hypothetical protein
MLEGWREPMGQFLISEKMSQEIFKSQHPSFSGNARLEGLYKSKPYPFCLPLEAAQENLFPGIREQAITFFHHHGIKWHDGYKGMPSNHLCDSQVCCVNFLFPFFNKPAALVNLFRPVFPLIERALEVESNSFVSFEWIGQKNYLGERLRLGSSRTRGANCTSADAIVVFERSDYKRQVVLIEWKYTESYGGNSLKISKNGTDRTSIYRPLFELTDCPINKEELPNFDSLFYEPFYQFMRQQFLANEMEKAHELGADIVSVLHIAPARNTGFKKVTSPSLSSLGESAVQVWKKLVRTQNRFISVSTEDLFGCLNPEPGLDDWRNYIFNRYPWVIDKASVI